MSNNLSINDINGSSNINNDTPFIFIKNMNMKYLTSVKPSINLYEINIQKIINDYENYPYLHIFAPLGQIIHSPTKQYFDCILCNIRVNYTTNNFELVDKNVWCCIFKNKLTNKICKSVGTIYNVNKPTYSLPVFSSEYFSRYDESNDLHSFFKNIYTISKYGKYSLNLHKFIINKNEFLMIDGSGELSNMHFLNKYKRNNLPVDFYNAQGTIDNNAYNGLDNVLNDIIKSYSYDDADSYGSSLLINNNINNIETSILPNDDSYFNNFDDNVSNASKEKKILEKNDIKKKITLKEKLNPWFLNIDIVGSDVLELSAPHKVTGIVNRDHMETFDNKNNDNQTDDDIYDNNDDNTYKINNIIIICIFICIIIILFYKKTY